MNTKDWVSRALNAEERIRRDEGWIAQLTARAEAAEAALATARRKLEARKTMLHVANAMWKSAQGEVEKQNAQLREMREALKAWVNDFEDHTDSHPEWVLNHYRRARAALASQQTKGEPNEA
jgi:chromosome segregation ATPase